MRSTFVAVVCLLLALTDGAWARMRWLEYRRFSRNGFTFALAYQDGRGRTLGAALRSVGGVYGTAAGYFAPDEWRNVDLTILQGHTVRSYLSRYGRPVLAVSDTGDIAIVRPRRGRRWKPPSNWWFAVAGDDKVTGCLHRETIRQIVAVTRSNFMIFKVMGSYWDCKRLMKKWGIGSYLFMDGASTAARGAKAPSHLVTISRTRFLRDVQRAKKSRRLRQRAPARRMA